MARATVKVTLEIGLADAWGNDWTVGHLFQSARDTAINMLQARMKNCDFRIVGTPEVTTIIYSEDKK